MSAINLHRPKILTPLSNNSPEIIYFTPTKIPSSQKKYSNYLHVSKSKFYPKTQSAERFRKREKLHKRRFYHHSPCTPNYFRCKSIQRRLNFDDCCRDEDKNLTTTPVKSSKPNFNVPSVIVTSLNHFPSNGVKNINDKIHTIDDQHLEIRSNISPDLKSLISNSMAFKKYQLLGRGKFGTVIQTEYKGIKVAAKFIFNCKRTNSTLLNEKNGIHLNHINIVNVKSVSWCFSHKMGIVLMKYYENALNLQTLLDNEEFLLDIFKILRYSNDICNAVHYLHSVKILHLDIKPKNILVFNNICKLCDFGSSFKYDDNSAVVSQFQGTVQYCAPEILEGQYPTTASDVYSIGITFWQIIHRSMPYDYKMRESLIYQIVKNNLRPSIKISLSSSCTLKAYKNIYTDCWSSKSVQRPTIDSILKQLCRIESML